MGVNKKVKSGDLSFIRSIVMQIYTNFRIMQKIIAIFAPQLHQNVAKNTDCLDFFGDFRRRILVRYGTRYFPFRINSFYNDYLRSDDFGRIL